MEDPHAVLAFEHRRLEVVAVFQLSTEMRPLTADQKLGALVDADADVVLDLLELGGRDLQPDLRVEVERALG